MSRSRRPKKAALPVERSRQELEDAVSHVSYEFQQLVDVAIEIARQYEHVRSPHPGFGYDVTVTISTACLESALLHVRNLLDFLDSRSKDDVTVRDYLPSWSPPKSEALKGLRAVRETLNSHLSHLTWKRITEHDPATGGNPPWYPPTLASQILDIFTDFVTKLQEVDADAAAWFGGTLAVASLTLRNQWPEILPEPSEGSPLRRFVRDLEFRRRPVQ